MAKRSDVAAFEAILTKVLANQNLISIPMQELRDAIGAGRLGVTVRASISRELAAIGLGHVPVELPDSQLDFVRVYEKGTSVAEIIEAALSPTKRHDGLLREMAAGDSQRILQKIKDLVCD